MSCGRCGAELDPGERFCGECGQPVQVSAKPSAPVSQTAVTTCPNCSDKINPGKRFCSSCGYDLIAGAQRSQAPVTYPAVPAGQAVTASTSTSSSRLALIMGLVALVGIFLLGSVGVGLWFLFGARKAPSIAGTWNCEVTELGKRQSSGGMTLIQEPPRRTFQMILVQSDSTVNITLLNDGGKRDQFTGSFDGKKISFTVLKEATVQLVLSPDGATMKGEAQDLKGGNRSTVICAR